MSKSYRFYMEIKTETGWEVVEWVHLTMQEAKTLHKQTERNCRTDNVKTYGWEEMSDV